jgi:hypothetical protein
MKFTIFVNSFLLFFLIGFTAYFYFISLTGKDGFLFNKTLL